MDKVIDIIYINPNYDFEKDKKTFFKLRQQKNTDDKEALDPLIVDSVNKLNDSIQGNDYITGLSDEINSQDGFGEIFEEVEFKIKSNIDISNIYKSLDIIPYVKNTDDSINIGDGKSKTLSMLLQRISYKNEKCKILIVEEPENHLYPLLQKFYVNLTSKFNLDQMIYTSHSPYIIDYRKMGQILKFIITNTNGHKRTCCETLNIDNNDYEAFGFMLNEEISEMFFYDKVLLVEGDSEKVILYGEKCTFEDENNPMIIDVYWALARAYYLRNNYESHLKAKEYINKCINKSEEEIEDFYYFKCEILSALEQEAELEGLLNVCYLKFGGNFNYYYLNVRLNLIKAKKDPQDIYFEEALKNADIALTYNPEEEYKIITLKIDIYTLQKKYDLAIEIVDELKKWFPEDDVLIEKLKIYEEINDFDSVKRISREYLENNDSWKIKYSLGYALGMYPTSENDLLEAKQLLDESFKVSDKLFIISDLFRVNKQLRLDEENLNILKPLLDEYPDNGGLYNLMGETIQRLNYPYEEIIYYYDKAYKLGWISEFEYLDDLLPLVDNPAKLNKKFEKYKYFDRRLLSGWMKRRIGIKYLYGESNYPKNINLANEYITEALNEFPTICCYRSTMGRFFELTKNYKKAFEHYDKGYFLYFNEVKPFCNCSAGYLAHSYLNGIGVEKNKERAKIIILDAIDEAKNYSCSTVIYLYCYFYLTDEEGFDGKYAKELLQLSYPFDRYEITRLIYLRQINNKLNVIDKNIDKQIKQVKKHLNKEAKEYLKKSLKEKVSYLFFGNY